MSAGRIGPAWRTHQPVRRNSHPATAAYDFCLPVSREDQSRHNAALDVYERKQRREMHRNGGRWGRKGPFGEPAAKLGRFLVKFAADATAAGRRVVAPGRQFLADALGYNVTSIDKAKAELRAHGWLDWIRRFEPVDDPGGKGPQVKQVSNAYRLLLPAAAAILLGFRGFRAPIPADARWTLDESAAHQHAHTKRAKDLLRQSLAAARGDPSPGPSAKGEGPLNR